MNLFKSAIEKLEDLYGESQYGIRIKAKILFFFGGILILFLPSLLVSNLMSGFSILQKPLLIILIDIFVIAVGLFLLFRGYYLYTVNLYITSLSISIIMYIILDTFYGVATIFHVNTLYYVFAVLVFSALFGSWKWLIALPILFQSFSLIYFLMIQDYIYLAVKSIKGVLIDFSFSLLAVSILSILIKKVNHSVIMKLEEYNTRLLREIDERANLEKQILTINETVRERIGQDLHDDLGQQLIAIKIRCEILQKGCATSKTNPSEEIKRIIQLVNDSVKKVRQTALGLGSVRLNIENFVTSLNHLAADSTEMYGIPCEFRYNRHVVIHDDLTAINLYRIVQESVTNAVKHGKAQRIAIELSHDEDILSIIIRNDGISYTEGDDKYCGLGIKLMKYRAGIIGGEFSIKADNDQGTIVKCSLHYPAKDL